MPRLDTLDAAVIALFAERMRPPLRPLPDEAARHLAELAARRRQVVEMMTTERHRQRQAAHRRVQKRLAAHIAWLEAELADVDRDLDRPRTATDNIGPAFDFLVEPFQRARAVDLAAALRREVHVRLHVDLAVVDERREFGPFRAELERHPS